MIPSRDSRASCFGCVGTSPACLIVAVADSTRWLQANSVKARNRFVANIELHQKAAAWVDHLHQRRVAQDALAQKDKLNAEQA
eukprot:COSAG01_NODE_5078_length_4502_cov_6.740177_5_plen_83_part_00